MKAGTYARTTTGSIRRRRKIRADAKLERLSPGQRVRLRIWLEDENRTYADVVQRIRAEFGLSVGKSAVGLYYRRHVLPDQADDLAHASTVLAALSAGAADLATLYQAKALAWSALARPQPEVRLATKLLHGVWRVEKRELARQRLALNARRIALRSQGLATRESRPPVPAAPAPSREISQNLPRFPGYSRIIQLPAPASPALLPTPLPPRTPTPATNLASQEIAHHPPRFPGYFRLRQPHARAQIPEPQPDLTPACEYAESCA